MKEKMKIKMTLFAILVAISGVLGITTEKASAITENSFVKTFGGTSTDFLITVKNTSDGGSIAVGYSNSTNGDLTGLNNGGTDAIIVKYDSLGNVQWKKNFGGTVNDFFGGVTQTSDGGFIVVGNSSSTNVDLSGLNKGGSDAIIVKYSASGVVLWKKNIGGTLSDSFFSVQQTLDGGLIAVGESSSTNGDFSGIGFGGNDAVIVKMDASGNVLWKKGFGGSSDDGFRDVQQIADGSYIATGHSISTTGGNISGTNKGDYDGIIVKYDALGNYQWYKSFGGSGTDKFTAVQKTSDGGWAVVGNSNSTTGDLSGINKGYYDGVIVKYDASGLIQWKKNFGGTGNDYFTGVQQTTDAGYIVSGYSNSNTNDLSGLNKGDYDGTLVKYDASGLVEWKKAFGGTGTDYFYGLLQKIEGGFTAVGFTTSTNGDLTSLSKGSADALIISTTVNGSIATDTTPPIVTLLPLTTGPTNTNVVVNATATDNVSVTQIKWASGAQVASYFASAGTDITVAKTFTVSSNGTYTVWATDLAGNQTVQTISVSNIDTVPPIDATFSADKTELTNVNVIVTVTFPTDGVVKEYRVNGGEWSAYTAPIVFATNGTLDAQSMDSAGNLSAVASYKVTNIDKIAPTTPLLTENVTSITNTDVTISIVYPSDATTKEYRVNGGAWTAYTAPVVFTINGQVDARCTDMAGNVSSIGSLNVNNIDKIPPSVPTLSADKTTPTNEDVQIVINYSNDTALKEYRINGGSWLEYTSQISVTLNGVVEARGTDVAGNVSSIAALNITNIDKNAPDAPSINADVTTPTNGNVNVTINYPLDASVKEYRNDGGIWTTYTVPVTFTTNGTLEARSIDSVGNTSNVVTYIVNNIDKEGPILLNTNFHRAYYSDKIVFTLSFPEDAVSKQYRIGDGEWKDYDSPIEVPYDESGAIYVRATDNVGNLSETYNSLNKVYIMTLIPNTTNPTKDVGLTITVRPVTRGIPFENMILPDGSDLQLGGVSARIDKTYTVKENGTYSFIAYNIVGDLLENSIVISNIDSIAPVDATFIVDKTYPTNGDVTVTIVYPADGAVKEYKVGNGTWTSYTTPVVLVENGTVYARSTDSAGNTSTVATYIVNNIDKSAPEAPLVTADKTVAVNSDVTVTVSYPADAAVKEYRVNGGTWTAYTAPIVMSVNGLIEARGTDGVGNVSLTAAYTVNNIDKQQPLAPSISLSNTSWSNDPVSVTVLSGSDTGSGVKMSQYKIGTNGTWNTYTTPIAISLIGQTSVYARTLDNAGNVSSEATATVYISNPVPPVNPLVDTDEPNNSKESATLIVGIKKSYIFVSGDVDYYKWTPSATGKVKVTFTAQTSNSYKAEILTTSQTVLATLTNSGTDSAYVNVTGGSSYYVKVSGATSSDYGTATYLLLVGDVDPDLNEPDNNSTASAPSIGLSSSKTGWITSSTDLDYFKFQTGLNAGKAKVRLIVPGDANYHLGIFKASENEAVKQLTTPDLSTGVTEEVVLPFQAGETYFFLVQNSGNSALSSGNYTLSLGGLEASTGEPNDTPEQASVIVPGTTYNTNKIETSGDKDYYKFTANMSGKIVVKLNGVSGKSYGLYVFRGEGNRLDPSKVSGTSPLKQVQFDVQKDEVYYVAVIGDSSSDYDAANAYSLNISSIVPDDESNDSWPEAKNVALGVPVTSYISVPGDEDYYYFTRSNTGLVRVQLDVSRISSYKDYDIKVYQENGTLLSRSNNNAGINEDFMFTAQANVKYYVKVYGFKDTDGNYGTEPYVLLITKQ
ncbi:beta strand repeat-containing protein [Paenibacillus whitsoniae]|uniref:Ig-like domain-containing protein n=1 Tax=Paenibacillus whitsoniae TaxID=2496558 RepID=A0A430JJN0_9BACL|nr:hypothetical protein [Paenibacillus whitsoniae]RTE11199.1 hypothetical protein EJQ19_02615 [Paenibacillus whitsoniae]